ncbi:MAG: glycosyltransferase family 4 protein [Dysgonamonadaceae bacterium]|nr:glycosyltransferase family 4 protein [Dysgonamonadaceae bacterium]
MKITVTGTRGIPNIMGGVETHCEELFPLLAKKGFDISLIRRTSYVHDSLSEYQNVQLYNIATPRKKAFEAIIHTLKAVHFAKFKLKAGVVHIHAVGPALAIPYAKLLGLKVVFTHHGPDYDREKWGKAAKIMLRLGERFGAKFADEIIVISEVIRNILQSKYGRNDTHLIYNGVPEPVFTDKTDYLNELGVQAEKYIFAMGRFVPEKNFHQLIQAFSSLDNKNAYRLVIAGDADFEDEYSLSLKRLAAENQVVLPGFVKGEKLQTLLTHAAAFVLPSSHEGLPISLLEAMNYRLPVIVSDIPANKAIGLSEEVYFKTGNITELSQKLTALLSQPSSKSHYKLENYRWPAIATQTAAVYNRLFTAPIPKM